MEFLLHANVKNEIDLQDSPQVAGKVGHDSREIVVEVGICKARRYRDRVRVS